VNEKLSELADLTAIWLASEIMVICGKVSLRHVGEHEDFRDLGQCLQVAPVMLYVDEVNFVVHLVTHTFYLVSGMSRLLMQQLMDVEECMIGNAGALAKTRDLVGFPWELQSR
jgi:hypothetical protein